MNPSNNKGNFFRDFYIEIEDILHTEERDICEIVKNVIQLINSKTPENGYFSPEPLMFSAYGTNFYAILL